MAETVSIQFTLAPACNEQLARLCGPHNAHLRQIEQLGELTLTHRGHTVYLTGSPTATHEGKAILQALYALCAEETPSAETIHLVMRTHTESVQPDSHSQGPATEDPTRTMLKLKKAHIKARTTQQAAYLKALARTDIHFAIGPAGTGKTFLAVAAAVEALEAQTVKRIILARPAVEAGERLGFLPGDLSQKVDPYLRPLYDGLYALLGTDKVTYLIEKGLIEVAPLAYMRGRTLSDAFIILDESQNTTVNQMRMFLTRIGFGSRAVITGDITQIDLPAQVTSGLTDAARRLTGIKGIGFTYLTAEDVVRHRLIKDIIAAYDDRASSQTHAS